MMAETIPSIDEIKAHYAGSRLFPERRHKLCHEALNLAVTVDLLAGDGVYALRQTVDGLRGALPGVVFELHGYGDDVRLTGWSWRSDDVLRAEWPAFVEAERQRGGAS